MPATSTLRPVVSAAPSDLPQIIVPKFHADHRGWFSETFHEARMHEHGITVHFVQDNRSQSLRAGTLRGLHFQLPPAAQAKLVCVLRGRIIDVAVDIRRDSPTFGEYVSVELSAQNGWQLYVPVGFAHGFCTLEDDVEVMYKVSNYFAPDLDCGICWDDQDIGFPWPFPGSDTIISEKDRRLPALKDLLSPFGYDGHRLAPLQSGPPQGGAQ
jgi:dTDP-4-dehydrorhamnose 3,5-epimerase